MSGDNIEIAIFIVNGISKDDNNLWLNVALSNITARISGIFSYRIFVWNHDIKNNTVKQILQGFNNQVTEITINDVDLDNYDPDGKYIIDKGYRFSKGFHVHRTPLQLLFEYANTNYKFDSFFTFDTDSWPLRNNWDLPLMFALNNGKNLVGIWRDELRAVIPPYIHPACLGMKFHVFKESGLRFDTIPKFPLEDSLSNITAYIIEKFGDDTILKLMRNNSFQYHSVFNGVYGSLIYHHHFGQRFKDKNTTDLKSFGWSERNEVLLENNIVMSSTTKMMFEDTHNAEILFLYGVDGFKYQKYFNYLHSRYSLFRIYRLFVIALKISENQHQEAFMILNLINSHRGLIRHPRFIELYSKVAYILGYEYEAYAYKNLIAV